MAGRSAAAGSPEEMRAAAIAALAAARLAIVMGGGGTRRKGVDDLAGERPKLLAAAALRHAGWGGPAAACALVELAGPSRIAPSQLKNVAIGPELVAAVARALPRAPSPVQDGRDGVGERTRADAVERLKAGASTEDIAALLGVERRTVQKWAKAAGVSRPGGRRAAEPKPPEPAKAAKAPAPKVERAAGSEAAAPAPPKDAQPRSPRAARAPSHSPGSHPCVDRLDRASRGSCAERRQHRPGAAARPGNCGEGAQAGPRPEPIPPPKLRYARWFLAAGWKVGETAALFDLTAKALREACR